MSRFDLTSLLDSPKSHEAGYWHAVLDFVARMMADKLGIQKALKVLREVEASLERYVN